MANIYDIARLANVSPATVSRALNGYADVSPKTRQRIQKIVEEVGYRPSAVARGLVTKRSMLIGVFFVDHVNTGFRHPFFQDILASFKDVIGREGYDLLFFSTNTANDKSMSYQSRAEHRRADGILLVAAPRYEAEVAALASSRIPCMSIDMDLIGPRAGYLTSDNYGGAIRAVDFLVQNGHTDIAFIGDKNNGKPGQDRFMGYRKGLQDHGLPFRSEWMDYGDYTESSGYEAANRLLSASQVPSAIFCAGDVMAIGAMEAIREHGLTPGRDISIIGFDDVVLARHVSPSLTTIAQNRNAMGEQAAIALVELMRNPNVVPPTLTIETNLVIRESVKPRI